MKIFKEIFLHSDNGSLFAMIPYVRHMEEGEVSVTALGAANDNLDDAIIEAVKSKYPNSHLYKSEEFNDNQIIGNLKLFGLGDTEVFTLILISKQVFKVPVTVWISKSLHSQLREEISPITIEYKTEKGINPKQIASFEALQAEIIGE